jgi:L-ascorbate metabolism protein UlaG (beta-lactamase superfamily)
MEISYLGKARFKVKTKLGIVTTETDHVAVAHKGETGPGFVIREPGEYEIEGISVFGYQAGESVVYVIQVEDMRILHLDSLSKALSEQVLSDLETVDVVLVPTDTLGAKEAVELMGKLEPYYILPYGEDVSKFITSFDHGSRSVKSLALSKLSLPEDLTEVIVFDDKI